MPIADEILRVDLAAERVTSEEIPEQWLERYVGGKGIGARYLYEKLESGTDPHSPANILLFVVGPLTGYTPGDQRYAAITKSPLTGTFLDSYAGGTFPALLAGSLDNQMGVLVTGEADQPVVLSIDGGEATLEPAPDLWGLDARETCEQFPDAAVACVGPAGEAGVQYATIASDGGDHHAGRGGAGTVMGAKKLKAVVVYGSEPEPERGKLADLRRRSEEAFADSDVGRWLAASETVETVDFANEVGALPTHGWQAGRFEGADEIGIERVREAATGRERPDDPVPGGFCVDSDEGESVPRGATPIVLGAGLGIDDWNAVATLGTICDRLGMDVITVGNAVAWAVRASQEGLIHRDLEFGDEEAVRTLIEEIATRSTPLGDALAGGVAGAAQRFGGDDLIPTVKGMELSSYDPRSAETMALAYATSDRGACHRRARPVELETVSGDHRSVHERVRSVVAEQNRRAVLWSLIADDFLEEVLRPDTVVEWLTAVGYDLEADDLALAGERIWTLVRLFNVREGFTREDDELPTTLTEPIEGGPKDGNAIDPDAFDVLLDRYYAIRDWDQQGRPTAALLRRLDLATVPDEETPVSRVSEDTP
ncbi:aldehyde ferredoxin oxidoreductase family protein [Haloarchaeobius amylolyticus]|uniref:Aldehyde ferredoxin oxidoreductase family protein n=1 Tax=Haloarchaeobius amylolyticus TaxID=1198296 RepID=A0ABD6BC66_9EURY